MLGQLGDWLPFTIVVRNSSEQTLVGYQVLWSAGTGTTWTVGGNSTFSPSGYLKPGGAVALFQDYPSRIIALPVK
jgi:hypothetical protein